MSTSRRRFLSCAIAAGVAQIGIDRVLAQPQAQKVKIGVLTDMSGALSAVLGTGSVDGARMAIEDFGKTAAGMPVELIFADHQNKPDLASSIARQWFDVEQVDLLLDLGSSGAAIAAGAITKDKNKILIVTGASSSDITGKYCNSNQFHWGYDTYMQSAAVASALTKRGGDTWFFITADYAYGHALENDARKKIAEAGGKVVGGVRHPANTLDMSSLLLQAQASGAKVIGIASAGDDLERVVKQGHEFGVWRKANAAAFGLQLYNIPVIGVDAMQGIMHNSIYYWDRDERSRDFGRRFWKRNGKPPSEAHAVNYSAVTHYLKAVKEAGTKETPAVLKALRAMPVDDPVTRNGRVRADGRLMRATYLTEVKKPDQVKEKWDLLSIVSEISAEDSFRPMADSACPLLKI